MNQPKFNIGDEAFIVRSSCHYGIKVPCTVCFGKRRVTVILGNDERVDSECGYCSHGIEPPSGQSQTWGPNAEVHNGPVTGVRYESGRWRYDVCGYGVEEDEIFATHEEAKPVKEAKLKEEVVL